MFFWFLFFLTTHFTALLANHDVNQDISLTKAGEYLEKYANTKNSNRKVRIRRQNTGDDFQGFPRPSLDVMWDFGEDDDMLIFDDDNSNSRRTSTLSRQLPFEPGVSNFQETNPPDNVNRGPSCEETCPSTQEYNPVCGDDNVTYPNIGKLQCAVRCGKRVALQFRGGCLTRARGK